MTPQERAKQLTEAHWNGYVKPLLAAHGLQEDWLVTIGFHYKSSGIHFYGHAWEDFLNGMFGPSAIGLEPAPEPPGIYLHGTHCDTCARLDCAKSEYPATKDGGCEGYIPNLRERMLDAKQEEKREFLCMSCYHENCPKSSMTEAKDSGECNAYTPTAKQNASTAADPPAPHTGPAVNCKECGSTACMGSGLNVTLDQGCDGFMSKEGSSGFNLTLPPIMLECNLDEIQRKFAEEMKELRETEDGSMEELIEAWDCIQVAQTYREHNGREDYADASGVADSLREWHSQGRPVMKAKRAMLVKNAARAMYSDHVNGAILATL